MMFDWAFWPSIVARGPVLWPEPSLASMCAEIGYEMYQAEEAIVVGLLPALERLGIAVDEASVNIAPVITALRWPRP